MPEQRQQTPFQEQLKGMEFKPGDVIPVESIKDFDVFSRVIAERLLKKHGGSATLFDGSWFDVSRPFEALKEGFIYGKGRRDVRFNGTFDNPRIIITDPPQLADTHMTHGGLTPDQGNNGIVEQFSFTIAMDMKSTGVGVYKIPAQLACNIYIVDAGERTIEFGNKPFTYRWISPYIHTEQREVSAAKRAIRKRETVSAETADTVTRLNLAKGTLPGSFETGKRR